jgi:hypothetical protein
VTTAGECKNCGAALAGPYCSACGQSADVRIPSVRGLLADVLGDLFNFDSRIWRSLVTLVLKPGRLTTAFLEGQRVRYAPPFRMYVLASVAFFLLLSLLRSIAPPAASADHGGDVVGSAGAAARVGAPPTDDIAPADEDDRVHIDIEDGKVSCKLDQDVTPAVRDRLVAVCERIQKDGGASYMRALADNVPVMMLVFIPIVAAIMRVLYLFARRKYVEHLLFFAHVHTFFFVLAIATAIVWALPRFAPVLVWPALIVTAAAAMWFLVYVYRAMRHVYAQGHALTAVKYVVLGLSYVVALMYTLVATIVITAVTV